MFSRFVHFLRLSWALIIPHRWLYAVVYLFRWFLSVSVFFSSCPVCLTMLTHLSYCIILYACTCTHFFLASLVAFDPFNVFFYIFQFLFYSLFIFVFGFGFNVIYKLKSAENFYGWWRCDVSVCDAHCSVMVVQQRCMQRQQFFFLISSSGKYIRCTNSCLTL